MFPDIIISTIFSVFVHMNKPVASAFSQHMLASSEMSLNTRYENSFVNDVFKDNILLNLAYLKGSIKDGLSINWDEVRKPFKYEMKLGANEVFAFHDSVLPEFKGRIAKTTNAHFNAQEGFKSDGYLVGDGVCHLASLINWAAKGAKLDVKAPTSHDFAIIPEVPREFGVSIYNRFDAPYSSELQNLYIRNNLQTPIILAFEYNGEKLKVTISEVLSN